MAEFSETRIGQLRYRLGLYRRAQVPAEAQSGIAETPTLVATVWGDVQPTGALTFYGSVQTDEPVTHRIRIRWRDDLDQRCQVQRVTTAPDGGTLTEIYRIRRLNDLDGRKRFLNIEAEQVNRVVA